MLQFILDCPFPPDSPLQQEFSNSPEQLITDRIVNRESEWFPYMSHDVRILQTAVTKLQARYVNLEAKIDAHQRKVDVLQLSTRNATRTAVSASADAAAALTHSLRVENVLQRLEDEISETYTIGQEFVQSFQ